MNDLQVRIDELESRLRVALAALEKVESIEDLEGNITYCPWCNAHIELWSDETIIHNSDCIRQIALAMPPQNIGEK